MTLFIICSVIGSAAFAISGWMLGIRKEMDVMGLFILAMLTANGGGAIRDILVDRTPVILTDINSFYFVCLVLLITFFLKLHKYTGLERWRFFIISDAIGLVSFSVTGAIVGIEYNLSFFGVLLLGFITATGGGIIRDIIINEVPELLTGGFYGSVSICIASALYILNSIDMMNNVNIIIIMLFGLALRLTAYEKNWHLPAIRKGLPYLK